MISTHLLLPGVSLKNWFSVRFSTTDVLVEENQKKPTIAKKVAGSMVVIREKEPKPQPKSKSKKLYNIQTIPTSKK